MGPDEYHDAYPDRVDPGLDNNAYTNVMATWVLRRAIEVLDLLLLARREELSDRIGLRREEVEQWDAISRGMYVPFHRDGVISEFEGYEQLKELDWLASPSATTKSSADRPASPPRALFGWGWGDVGRQTATCMVLVRAVVRAESSWDFLAVSPASFGSRGRVFFPGRERADAARRGCEQRRLSFSEQRRCKSRY